MGIKRLISILLVITISIPFLGQTDVMGNNQTTSKKEIVFVLDRSGSMKTKDSNNLANEFVKMYIDTLYSENTSVGLVGFNDSLVSSVKLTSLDTANNRNYLKREVDKMQIKGETDIGLALKEATSLINNDSNAEKIIVLISDGETDLGLSKKRTYEQSEKDNELAIDTAISNNCKIHTVGIKVDDTDYLREIAEKTQGTMYSTKNSSDLYNVFQQLSNELIEGELISLDAMSINGVVENVSLKLPSDYVRENNVIVTYNKPLNNISTKDSDIYKSRYYSSFKLNGSEIDNIDLKMVSNGATKISIFYNVTSSLEPVFEPIQKISDDEYVVRVKVLDNVTNEEINKEYYKNLNATLKIVTNGETSEVSLQETEDGLGTKINIPSNNQDNTTVYVVLDNGTSAISGEKYDLSKANNQPVMKKNSTLKILLDDKEKSIELDKYFSDADNDTLYYKVVNANTESIENLALENNEISFTTVKEGTENIDLIVTDGNGGITNATLSLEIMPFWVYYKKATLILGMVSIMLLLILIVYLRKKSKLEVQEAKVEAGDLYVSKSKDFFRDGRIEGYFLATKSGKDYPALFWNETYLANKSLITLGELLSYMDIDESLMEARKIFFEATENESIIFWHKTKCTVYLGNLEVVSGKQVELKYDSKMYIIFEDGETEIEIRYKRVKKKAYV